MLADAKPAMLYALLLRLSDNGREPIRAGVTWLAGQVEMSRDIAQDCMVAWRELGYVDWSAKQGRGTRIRSPRRGWLMSQTDGPRVLTRGGLQLVIADVIDTHDNTQTAPLCKRITDALMGLMVETDNILVGEEFSLWADGLRVLVLAPDAPSPDKPSDDAVALATAVLDGMPGAEAIQNIARRILKAAGEEEW